MPVPQQCITKIGKREIVQSLKTTDPQEAKTAAKKLAAVWKEKFRSLSCPVEKCSAIPAPATPTRDEAAFRRDLIEQMEKNLPDILYSESDKDLRHRLQFYEESILAVKNDDWRQYDLPEIGIRLPLKPSMSPGFDRMRKRVLGEVLKLMCEAVSKELENTAGEEKTVEPPADAKRTPGNSSPRDSITEAVEMMIAAKRIPEKTAIALRADIRLLREWCAKDDLISFTKKDLIDFVQNALPYIPANMNKKKKVYAGKTARECVALTKADPQKHKPISHRTCENRQANLSAVFNYAKDHLGLITVNPAKDIQIPEVRVTPRRDRGYLPHELNLLWSALQELRSRPLKKPSCYWSTVLSLYHGFRLNEVCSLFLKDVYEDQDGVFVIDINDDGPLKSVKNQSSVRVVPVHPFVRDRLGFRDFVEEQKKERAQGVLFTDVTGTEKNGYIRQTSYWFARWKNTWLPPESRYKHFHDLRYTFIQTAQNVARMPDRHSQEITGHAIEGVSAVHLGYSGRLKPAALLEELQKVQYGWESSAESVKPLPAGTPRPVQSSRGTAPRRVVKRSALDREN